jgi:hypothetical protein
MIVINLVLVVVPNDFFRTSALGLLLRIIEGRVVRVVAIEVIIVFILLGLRLHLEVDFTEIMLFYADLGEYLMGTDHLSMQCIILNLFIAEVKVSI